MEVFYELWDVEEARLINDYDTLDKALAVVTATAHRYGDAMVATWGLFRATPTGDRAEIIAEGEGLMHLAREHMHVPSVTAER